MKREGVYSTTNQHGVTTEQAVEANYIPEGDVYRLIIRSNLPSAERFERWVFDEVLPSIRKHGGYLTEEKIEEALLNPDILIRLATDLKNECEARRLAEEEKAQIEEEKVWLEEKVKQDKPKVLFADSVSASEDTILIGDLAKFLRQNGIDIGQNRLFERLRNEGFLHRTGTRWNTPTQKAMDMGLFEVQERVIQKPDGSPILSQTTKVTGKGQLYFINRYLRQEEVKEA